MIGHRADKLKNLLETLPPGFLVDSRWLEAHGIYRQLAHSYLQAGWLERPLQGLYRRPFIRGGNESAERDWKIPVLSAQWIMDFKFHVAATTAMELHGYTHYLRMSGPHKLYLHGDAPSWLSRLDLSADVTVRQGSLFQDMDVGVDNKEFSLEDNGGELQQSPWQWPMRVSSPERALLETIDEAPNHESFHQIDVLFQSMANLRPKLMTQLLKLCRSVKTKRLFFVFAERHTHAWRKYIDETAIDLGSGDRMLVKGGKLHPHYRITIPAEFVTKGEQDGA
ncbi:hypothetical protein VW29_09895 [Devosia limi DSM 17137]|uniref:Transcriptional regulator, AbiEi antitoxin, Type IV TA system n=1 Tax=Devosia limi DSM 17137 TaxID=1121477 RepID=A0A0F5LSR1_9HYPH|nr:type IV toxin-antitoxin system AbiEi family antitoxin domain-containing protein [Devosia limi]KKB84687.1 hypothetical protein VW29_09895 [Devosia limi DSM 17137]SHF53983.1 Transcriptional regulator, AbiEi antitoxin, Type IV TA system [Devosia limi DSM 17137]